MTRPRWTAWIVGAGVGLGAALAGCGRKPEHVASPPAEGRTFHPAPASVPAEAWLAAGAPRVLPVPGPEGGGGRSGDRQPATSRR
jgi:hypothetical protein